LSAAIIIPTYNERENLRELVEEILALGLPSSPWIIVVDDHSPDGTGEVADALAAEHPEVQVIHRAGKLGLGTAYTAGFRRALALGAERILTMDADFSHLPSYIPSLLAASQHHGLSIGSRYVPGGGVRHWGVGRRLLSWGANTLARLVLGLKAHDCTAGYRCYRREVLASLDFDTIFADGYSYLIEILYRCQRRGFRVAEVPIVFTDRRRGASKISKQEIFKAGGTVLRLALDRLRQRARHVAGLLRV
jgi:dolichol-phosphate mannosyltransferase